MKTILICSSLITGNRFSDVMKKSAQAAMSQVKRYLHCRSKCLIFTHLDI